MSVVYVAAPYTSPDTETNVLNAIVCANTLKEHGITPFVPHFYHFWDKMYPHDYEYWMSMCFEMLSRCDAVLRLVGTSSGADREVELAKSLNIPVFYAADADYIIDLMQHIQK